MTGVVVIAAAGAYLAWQRLGAAELPAGIAKGNGRIEATEIGISTKLAGRLKEITVREGDFVTAGQVLAIMDSDTLEAQKRQAGAEKRRAEIGVETAGSVVKQRLAENESAQAVVAQREVQLEVARKTLDRAESLAKTSVVSQQVLDDTRSAYQGGRLGASRRQGKPCRIGSRHQCRPRAGGGCGSCHRRDEGCH